MIQAELLGASILQTGLGLYQGFQTMKTGKELANKYRSDIESFQRGELTNAYRGLRAPTEGLQLATENIGASTAQALSDVSKLGTQGYGATQGILKQQASAYENAVASYEQQKMLIDQMIAQDEVRIQQQKAQQENVELQALGRGLESAMQMEQSGKDAMFGAVQGGIGAATTVLGSHANENAWRKLYGQPTENIFGKQKTQKQPYSYMPNKSYYDANTLEFNNDYKNKKYTF